MKILPPQTLPPETPIRRRHNPRPANWRGGYRTYHECLSWDFGFTCAFCLLHEADLVLQGAEGLGVSTAEHLVPQCVDETLANDYTNIVNACRFCNRARSNAPRVAEDGRLLDPTEDAWANHFWIKGDQLVPHGDDADALRTYKVYDLDDDRKVARREFRRTLLVHHMKQFIEGQERYQWLLDEAQIEGDPEKSLDLLQLAKEIYTEVIYPACLFLKCYSAIPINAPKRCRCETTEMHCLPEEFERQMQQIEM